MPRKQVYKIIHQYDDHLNIKRGGDTVVRKVTKRPIVPKSIEFVAVVRVVVFSQQSINY